MRHEMLDVVLQSIRIGLPVERGKPKWRCEDAPIDEASEKDLREMVKCVERTLEKYPGDKEALRRSDELRAKEGTFMKPSCMKCHDTGIVARDGERNRKFGHQGYTTMVSDELYAYPYREICGCVSHHAFAQAKHEWELETPAWSPKVEGVQWPDMVSSPRRILIACDNETLAKSAARSAGLKAVMTDPRSRYVHYSLDDISWAFNATKEFEKDNDAISKRAEMLQKMARYGDTVSLGTVECELAGLTHPFAWSGLLRALDAGRNGNFILLSSFSFRGALETVMGDRNAKRIIDVFSIIAFDNKGAYEWIKE